MKIWGFMEHDKCFKCVNQGLDGCKAGKGYDFDPVKSKCESYSRAEKFAELRYKCVKLEHIGGSLFANGRCHAGIGEGKRSDEDYIAIYEKYLRGC